MSDVAQLNEVHLRRRRSDRSRPSKGFVEDFVKLEQLLDDATVKSIGYGLARTRLSETIEQRADVVVAFSAPKLN
jgi:hypothetical protein